MIESALDEGGVRHAAVRVTGGDHQYARAELWAGGGLLGRVGSTMPASQPIHWTLQVNPRYEKKRPVCCNHPSSLVMSLALYT